MIFKKKANAKINLLLDLRCSLPDGYHSIFTCMQSVSLADTLLLEPLDSGEIILSCSEPSVPCDGRNSCAKAAKLFLDSAGIATGVHIRIEKYIPTQAGLAGGSADAAAVLSALSEAYPGKLSQKQLFEIALKVGADVPFCLHGGTALCQNKGEIISPLPDFESFVLIVKPDFSISTAQAYKNFDMMKEPEHPDNEHFLYYAAQGDYKNALTFSANVFENLQASQEAQEIKREFRRAGAYFSAMSGSGSAFFGLFGSEQAAKSCAEEFRSYFSFVELCTTKKCGVE